MKSMFFATALLAFLWLFSHRATSQTAPASATAKTAAAPGAGRAEGDIRQAPVLLKPGDHGVGQMVADVAFTDINGKTHRVSTFTKSRAVVFAATSTSCPLSKKYLHTLAAMAREFTPLGITFICINPTATDDRKEILAAAGELGEGVVYVHDTAGTLIKAAGITTTTDVIVIDGSRTIIYHGAVDDQYGLGYTLDAPRHAYLKHALTAHLAGRVPQIAATTAPGCSLDLPKVAVGDSAVTYHNRISRLMQRHCVQCHRDGGVAPFTLTSYEDVVAHAGMIRKVVERGVMPPWFAVADEAADKTKSHGSAWASDRSLAESEKADLLAWIAAGKVAGDSNDAPKPREFPDGWSIGKPDDIFEFQQPVAIKATGTMPYQHVVVETNLPEDRWVQAIEIQPGAREAVHHVLVMVVGSDNDTETENAREQRNAERRGYWAAYVPGNSSVIYPQGLAKKLPKGAKLRFQMHYTPTGKATQDRTRIGIVYAKEPPRHEVHVYGLSNVRIKIPAQADNHPESASVQLPFDIQVLSFLPHMHVRGKACRYEVIRADGSRSTPLNIPHYDFNWQLRYQYHEPLALSQGDTIEFTAWYDNSNKNPANPDPSKEVRWGPQTFDEMHLGYIEYIMPADSQGEPLARMGREQITDAMLDRITQATFKRLDVDGNGKLSLEEARKLSDRFPHLKRNPAQLDAGFRGLDANQDGTLDMAEFAKLRESLRPGR